MALSDPQFNKLIETITRTQEDHDLLTEIKTYTKSNNENFIKHCEEDSMFHGEARKSLGAAHRRIDVITISGILSLIVLALSIWLRK